MHKSIRFVHVIRIIKVRFKKAMVYISKDRQIIDPLEPKVLLLCRSLIQDSHSILHVCPITGNRYISNDYEKIYAVIEHYRIKIASSSFQDVELSQYGHRSICQIFDAKLNENSNQVLEHFKDIKNKTFDKTLSNYFK